MSYTIKQAAEIMNVTPTTLRYYDKQGLLPFMERKRTVEAQMAELQETLDFINHKCWYYETAIEAGTEKIHFKESITNLPCEL